VGSDLSRRNHEHEVKDGTQVHRVISTCMYFLKNIYFIYIIFFFNCFFKGLVKIYFVTLPGT